VGLSAPGFVHRRYRSAQAAEPVLVCAASGGVNLCGPSRFRGAGSSRSTRVIYRSVPLDRRAGHGLGSQGMGVDASARAVGATGAPFDDSGRSGPSTRRSTGFARSPRTCQGAQHGDETDPGRRPDNSTHGYDAPRIEVDKGSVWLGKSIGVACALWRNTHAGHESGFVLSLGIRRKRGALTHRGAPRPSGQRLLRAGSGTFRHAVCFVRGVEPIPRGESCCGEPDSRSLSPSLADPDSDPWRRMRDCCAGSDARAQLNAVASSGSVASRVAGRIFAGGQDVVEAAEMYPA